MQKDAHARALGGTALFFASILVFALDISLKRLFFTFPERWIGSFPPGTSWFQITQHVNEGATFNAPVPVWLLVFCSCAFLSWFLVTFFRFSWWWKHPGALFSASLLIGGAVGNLYDRLSLGYVRDWLLIGNLSVLNLADFCIIFGCLGLFFTFASERPRQLRPSMERDGA